MSRFFNALTEASRQSAAGSAEQQWASKPNQDASVASVNSSVEEELSLQNVFALRPETDNPAGGEVAENEQAELLREALDGTEPLPSQNGIRSESHDFPPDVPMHINESMPLLPSAADSIVVEHYRRLRTKILQQQSSKAFRTLLIASPSPQEGKTVTALNLALSFGMLPSFKVLVVDGDLRRGSIGRLLGQGDRPGFSDLIAGTARLSDVLIKPEGMPVHFVLRGSCTLPRAELLNSPRLRSQLQLMEENFDLVLIDSPPVNLLTDTQLLAANCDAILLVARAFSTTRKALEQAVADLKGLRILGTVLNGGTRTQLYHRYNGYYNGK